MSGQPFSTNDAAQLRELADAIRELERALNSGISSELQAIADALRGLSGPSQESTTGLERVLNALDRFTLIGGIAESINALRTAFDNVGPAVDVAKRALLAFKTNPKILGITLLVGGIALVVGGLISAFRDSGSPTREFTQNLNEMREAHQALRDELDQSQRSTANTGAALFELERRLRELAEAGEECIVTKSIMRSMMDELNAKATLARAAVEASASRLRVYFSFDRILLA